MKTDLQKIPYVGKETEKDLIQIGILIVAVIALFQNRDK